MDLTQHSLYHRHPRFGENLIKAISGFIKKDDPDKVAAQNAQAAVQASVKKVAKSSSKATAQDYKTAADTLRYNPDTLPKKDLAALTDLYKQAVAVSKTGTAAQVNDPKWTKILTSYGDDPKAKTALGTIRQKQSAANAITPNW